MGTKQMIIAGLLIVSGIAVDIYFICTEYAKKMKKATVLKGVASFLFVLLGAFLYSSNPASVTFLILLGLIFGMLGDIFLNMRNLYEGAVSNKIFAVGILFFLLGHFMYIASLICCNASIVLSALILSAVLSILAIPPLMRQITAPSKGLKIFGYVYLVIVITMFSMAAVSFAGVMPKLGVQWFYTLFAIGSALFVVSDFIMIYYSFGKKILPLRAINLFSYYIAQILIALCVGVFV